MAFKFKNLPPKEAVDYFKRKGYAIGFDWEDVWQQEHAAAFTVAKVTRLDILEDIRGAVDAAIEKGITPQQFKKNLTPILQAKGWWGKQDRFDPVTKEVRKVQLGSARRLQTIFDVNMRTAYAAGKWDRAQRTKKSRPYLRYVAVMDGRTRAQHKSWHGTVLPIDHEFWKTHYPPNGWRCRCTVQTLSDRDLKRFGHKLSPDPKIKTRKWVNKRTGEIHDIPVGIDAGFNYNVGTARARAFTPPPTGGLPTTFPKGMALPDLPKPRTSTAKILPGDLADDEYIDRFLGAFGAKRGQTVHFTDKAGEALVMSEDLFRAADGMLKLKKHGRHRQLMLMADTIKDPDEIWWAWEPVKNKPGAWLLRRRYIRRFPSAHGQGAGVGVFEWGKDGWVGVTTFPPATGRPTAQNKYLKKLRGGTLAYRKK